PGCGVGMGSVRSRFSESTILQRASGIARSVSLLSVEANDCFRGRILRRVGCLPSFFGPLSRYGHFLGARTPPRNGLAHTARPPGSPVRTACLLPAALELLI